LTSTEVDIKIKHMRKEPFFVGDYVHVFNRGNRKMDIVRDNIDLLGGELQKKKNGAYCNCERKLWKP
jgi:hypothetical protein